MTDDQRAKYAALIALRNTEATLRWTRSQLFIFINSAGLTLVVTQRQLGFLFLFAAGAIGLLLMTGWILATRRANQYLAFWHAQLEAAENPPEEKEIVIFGSKAQKNIVQSRVTINRVLMALMIVFVALWIIVLVWSFFLPPLP